jgi:tetratricopeptide (TPR) repeat protein
MHRRPSEYFIDREGVIEQLDGLLRPNRPEPSIVTLHGLAGVGKTQVALAYWQSYGWRYNTTHWVRARGARRLAGDYRRIADELGLRSGDQGVRDVVRRWFESAGDWLLVLDDAPSSEALDGYLPAAGAGSVLITSRNAVWGRRGKALELEPLGRAQAISFLVHRGGGDGAAAGVIADELGCLPLALEEAASSMRQHGLTLEQYARRLSADPEAALALGGSSRSRRTIAGIWSGSLRSIRRDAPAAHDLLCLLSYVAPQELEQACLWDAEELLGLARPSSGPHGAELAQELIAALRRHSLVQTESAESAGDRDTVSVHRLVQAVVRARMAQEDRRRWTEAALRIIARAFPLEVERRDVRQTCERLVVHAQVAAGHAQTVGAGSSTACELLGRAGWYQWQLGRVDSAERLLQDALEVAERRDLGAPVRTWLRNRLGLLLSRSGRLERAAAVLETARALNPGQGGDAAERRFTLNALGLVYQAQQRDDDARAALEESAGLLDPALEGQAPPLPWYPQRRIAEQRSSAGEHAIVPSLLRRGRQSLEEDPAHDALPEFLEALEIARRLWGARHPEVALCLEHLGRAMLERDDSRRAYRFLERARRIDEAWYGRRHPRVASDLDALGLALRRRDPRRARELLSRAIEINQEQLGADHPTIGHNLMHLAEVLVAERDLSGAIARITQALEIYQAHPEAALAHHWVAFARTRVGDLKEIRDLFGPP